MAPLMSVKEKMLKGLRTENKIRNISSIPFFFVKKVSGRGRSVFTKKFLMSFRVVVTYIKAMVSSLTALSLVFNVKNTSLMLLGNINMDSHV